MRRHYQNQEGFTLVEMIVVIVLIATMLAFSIPNLRHGRVRQDIKYVARQFATDLRYVQSQNLAQKVFNENQNTVHSIGVYIDRTQRSYIIFENMNDDNQYDQGVDTPLNAVSMHGDVIIKNIAVGSTAQTAVETLTLFFTQTSEEGAIGSPVCTELDCTQKLFVQFGSPTLPNESINVVVNPSGLVEKP